MAWSMMAATGAHAAVFAFWPAWHLPDPSALVPVSEFGPMEWISLYEAPPQGTEGSPATSPLTEGAGAIPIEPDLGARATISEEDLAALSDALRDRILRAGFEMPTIAEPLFESLSGDPLDSEGQVALSSGDSTTVRGRSASADGPAAEFPSLEGLSPLDLERLSAIRPEVTLEASSVWVLVRNAAQVNAFMQRRATRGELDPDASGSVSVALWVSATGSVEWTEIVQSSGRTDLDDAALTLFNEVVIFRPARLEGVPMPISAIFTLNFPWR
jgi:TonB family protein